MLLLLFRSLPSPPKMRREKKDRLLFDRVVVVPSTTTAQIVRIDSVRVKQIISPHQNPRHTYCSNLKGYTTTFRILTVIRFRDEFETCHRICIVSPTLHPPPRDVLEYRARSFDALTLAPSLPASRQSSPSLGLKICPSHSHRFTFSCVRSYLFESECKL